MPAERADTGVIRSDKKGGWPAPRGNAFPRSFLAKAGGNRLPTATRAMTNHPAADRAPMTAALALASRLQPAFRRSERGRSFPRAPVPRSTTDRITRGGRVRRKASVALCRHFQRHLPLFLALPQT